MRRRIAVALLLFAGAGCGTLVGADFGGLQPASLAEASDASDAAGHPLPDATPSDAPADAGADPAEGGGVLAAYGVPPTVVTNSEQEMVAFALDVTRSLDVAAQSSPSQYFLSFAPLAFGPSAAPAALDVGDGRLVVYFTDILGVPRCAAATETDAGTTFLPAVGAGDAGYGAFSPAIAAKNDGTIEVFALTSAGALAHAVDDGACDNGGWVSLAAGPFASSPAVAKDADGHLDVFLLDRQGAMWSVSESGPDAGFGDWNAPEQAMGPAFASGPVVGYEGDGRIAVFAVDATGNLRHVWQTVPSGPFGDWSGTTAVLGTSFAAPPAVAQNADGTIEVVAVDLSGALLRQRQVEANAEEWASSWETINTGCTSSPALGHNEDGRLELFAICELAGLPGWQLAHTWQTSTVNESNDFVSTLTPFGITAWPPMP